MEKMIDDMAGVFTDPIVVAGPWGSDLPQEIRAKITVGRLVSLRKGEELACDAEICAYLMSASLEAPLDSDWVDIYMHVMTKEYPDKMKSAKLEMPELSSYQMGLLNGMKRKIYNSRIKHRNERLWAERRQKREVEKATRPRQLTLEQLMKEVECETPATVAGSATHS